jgi:hypothetical protein
MTNSKRALQIAAVAVLVPLAACSDLLNVESPGRIADSDLETRDAIAGMITGMKYDLSQAVDASIEFMQVASAEMYHGGSYDWADVPRGVINDDDPGVGGFWNSAQQARWVAEHGIEDRLRNLLEADEFSRSADVAAAYVYAGFANRMLGANWCSSVIDGGPEIPNTDHFARAEEHFTQAIAIAQAAGSTDLVNAAFAGRAQVRVLQSDWTGAVADAAKVPVDFVFNAAIDIELRNELYYETHTRNEYTVWGTYMADHPDDPRAPWIIPLNSDGSVQNGANGSTPHYRQMKYLENGADVPLAKGTEMLLVQAEAALHANDMTAAYGFMNQARAFYGMDPLTQAADITAAWADLHFERGATLWIESRRFEDLRRWYNETGPAHNNAFEGRATCVPISEAEKLANDNIG